MSDEKQLEGSPLQISSGNLLLVQLFEAQLADTTTQPLSVIVDAPWGYAFEGTALVQTENSLILTDNPCGEYLEDLWDLSPTVLIGREVSLKDFIFFVKQAAQGQKYKVCPTYQTPLTKSERKTLRLCADDPNLIRVAQKMYVSHGTLKNSLSHIYDKLDLQGLADLRSYYYGSGKNSDYTDTM